MIIECDYCQKEFDRPINKIKESTKNNWKQYCCDECSTLARIKKIKCYCTYCQTELLKTPSEIKRSKTGNSFCNKSCAASYNNLYFRTGENNPNWKNGSYSGMEPRKIAYEVYEPKCVICGFDEFSALQVHHIDQNRNNNDVDNLIVLCANHHCMIHYGSMEITKEIKDKRA